MLAGRVGHGHHVLALAATVAKRGDGRRGVTKQPIKVGTGRPGLGHHLRTVARANAGLVSVDQLIQRGRVDVAFLREHGLQRAHAQIHFAEFAVRVVVIRTVIVIVMMVVVVVVSHDSTDTLPSFTTLVHLVISLAMNWRNFSDEPPPSSAP